MQVPLGQKTDLSPIRSLGNGLLLVTGFLQVAEAFIPALEQAQIKCKGILCEGRDQALIKWAVDRR